MRRRLLDLLIVAVLLIGFAILILAVIEALT